LDSWPGEPGGTWNWGPIGAFVSVLDKTGPDGDSGWRDHGLIGE
jgi:hypothetical protein